MSAPGTHEVPSAGSTIWTLAAITFKRLVRGKTLWIGVGLVAIPLAYAIARQARHAAVSSGDMFVMAMLILAVLPAMYVAASVGDDLENRTSTYLWSRAIPRWAVLAGKLAALTPVVIALMVGSWYATIRIGTGAPPSLPSLYALAAGSIAAAVTAAGIATVVPKQGMVLTIAYLLADNAVGALPFTLAELSITYHTKRLAHLEGGPLVIAAPLIGLAVIAGLWAVIGALRIRRLET
jgi:ABC-type transport system involved in multi-copper enzyme maturation permease subunit